MIANGSKVKSNDMSSPYMSFNNAQNSYCSCRSPSIKLQSPYPLQQCTKLIKLQITKLPSKMSFFLKIYKNGSPYDFQQCTKLIQLQITVCHSSMSKSHTIINHHTPFNNAQNPYSYVYIPQFFLRQSAKHIQL